MTATDVRREVGGFFILIGFMVGRAYEVVIAKGRSGSIPIAKWGSPGTPQIMKQKQLPGLPHHTKTAPIHYLNAEVCPIPTNLTNTTSQGTLIRFGRRFLGMQHQRFS